MLANTVWDILPSSIEKPALDDDPFWGDYAKTHQSAAIHVAILAKPYLDLLLDSKKTVESRFSVDRRPPYAQVSLEDVLLLKQSGGPIYGIARVANLWHYEITPQRFGSIRRNFGERLQIEDPEMWARFKKALYATLIELDNVQRLADPISYIKKDQRAWVIFKPEKPLPLFG